MFDESYNVREVLDDLVERINLREKLIQTARQLEEKKEEEKFGLAARQFENLMADFLRLYQPILERVRAYRDNLHKEVPGLKSSLATVNGMLEVSRGLEGLENKVKELEANTSDLDNKPREKTKILEKIEGLLKRVRPYVSTPSSSGEREHLSEMLEMPKGLYLDIPDTTKENATNRKSAMRG